MKIAYLANCLWSNEGHIPGEDGDVFISLGRLACGLDRVARAPLLSLLNELYPQLRDRLFNQAGFMPHDHVHIFRWHNLPRRIHYVPYERLAADFVQNLWPLALKPCAFSRSHDHDGKLHLLSPLAT